MKEQKEKELELLRVLTLKDAVGVGLGASTAMLGVLLSQILGISRMMLAMGRRHDLPPVFQIYFTTASRI